MSALTDLRTGITFINVKGDVRQPHNYGMGRIPARYSRWHTAFQYLTDVERILLELKLAVSFASSLPDDNFLLQHSVNSEDYIMYHQGYFLDLVHQLKDKLCQLVKAIVTPKNDYSVKQEEEVKLSRLIDDKYVIRVPKLQEYLKEWDDGSQNGYIAITLKKRTNYHHYKNPLPGTDSYLKIKSLGFLANPSLQSSLSDYGKQMVAERGKQSLQSWWTDTVDKISTTLGAVTTNIENIAQSLVSYYQLSNNIDSDKLLIQRYMQLDKLLEVPDSSYSIEMVEEPSRALLKELAEILPFVLGSEFVAFYVTGSVARGDFMWGLSDVNFVVVIKNNQADLVNLIQNFIDSPAVELQLPIDTQILSEEEFMSPEKTKLRFICRTDGLLVSGANLLKVENSQKICFKLAWLLNKDFKEYITSLKATLNDSTNIFTQHQLTLMVRTLGKRAYRLVFSQVIGNNTMYTQHFKKMRELNNFYYPKNRKFNDIIFQLFSTYPVTNRQNIIQTVEMVEKQLMPLYNAIDKVVNGVVL